MIITRRRGVFRKKIKGKWYLLKKNEEETRELNETAGFIWELAKNKVDIKTIIKFFTSKYQIEASKARRDVENFVSQYLKEGFLIRAK